jgi:hypothetical protein
MKATSRPSSRTPLNDKAKAYQSACLDALQPGDTLVFWKSDRFGRSAAHVLAVVDDLRQRGIKVMSLTESFDLDTAGPVPVHRARRRGRVRTMRQPQAAPPRVWPARHRSGHTWHVACRLDTIDHRHAAPSGEPWFLRA